MTRVKHHKARRGAMTLASAVVAAAAATAVLAQAADEAPPRFDAIPDGRENLDLLPVDPAADDAPEAPAAPEPEPEPEAEAEAEPQPGDEGVRLAGNLPSRVEPNPERRITLSLSETLSGDTDLGMDGGDGSLGSSTRLGLSYISIGPISSYSVSANLGFNHVLGSDADTDVPLPTFSAGWQRSLSRTTQMSLGLNGSVIPQTFYGDPVYSLTDSDDDGVLEIETDAGDEEDALRVSLGGTASLSHTINSINSVSLGVSASMVDFIDGGASLTPYTNFGLNGGWNAQLTPTLSGGLSSGMSAYFSDGADERSTYTFNVSGNTGWTVNRRLSMNASLGPNLSFSSSTDASTGLKDEYTSLSARGQVGISYALNDTKWAASLSQGVQPSSDGAIANTTSLSLRMRHQINDASAVSAATSLSYYLPLSEEDEDSVSERLNLSLRTSYSYALTKTVDASLGYAIRLKHEDDESFVSHKVFLTLTKSFTFLP